MWHKDVVATLEKFENSMKLLFYNKLNSEMSL